MIKNSSLHIDESKLQLYQNEYAETSCILLPGLLTRNTLQLMTDKIKKADFQIKYETDQDEKFGKVLFIPQNNPVIFILNMLFNHRGVFSILQQITSCDVIKSFNGRVHRSEAGENHYIGWHGDNADNRLLAMTLSLGTERHTGGVFQIREKGSTALLREFGQIEAGDALIFKINPCLQHRLTSVESGSRTVGVGWFRSV